MIPKEFWEHGRIRPDALLKLPGPFSVTEVRMALGCSDEWLYKCLRAGAIKAGRLGRNWRISAEEARKLYFSTVGITADTNG